MHLLGLPVPELLAETGALTNLRVCENDISKVLPIMPLPDPNTVWVHEAVGVEKAAELCGGQSP